MKKIKFLVMLIMICLMHIINGEVFQRYIKYIPSTSTNFSFTVIPQNDEKEVIDDLCGYANKHNILLYMEIPSSPDVTSYNIDLYCNNSENVKVYFQNKYKLDETTYKSIFSGKTSIYYHDAKNIPNLYSCSCIYVVGTNYDIQRFATDVLSKYAISNIQDGIENIDKSNILIAILCMIGVVLFLLTLYELSMNKKGTVISISLGESAGTIILKNIIVDLAVLLSIYTVSIFILSFFTYTYLNITRNTILFLLIIFVNSFLYIRVKWYNFKKAFAKNTSENELLTASYLIKFITTSIIIVVLLPNCIFIKKAVSYNKQEYFFAQFKNYNYITFGLNHNIQTDDFENELQIMSSMNATYDNLYKKLTSNDNVSIIMNITPDKDNIPILYYNRHNFKYLCSCIQEIEKTAIKEKIYICIPQNSDLLQYDDSTIINTITNKSLVSLENLYNYECEVIRYKKSINVISIDSYLPEGSEIIKNPIIIFNNINESKVLTLAKPNGSFLSQFRNIMMYRMNNNEFESYMLDSGFSAKDYRYTITNVYQNFTDQKSLINRELWIVSIVSIMLIMLQAGIIIIILKLEYQIKSSEYCIKCILGYSSFEINRYIYIHTIINYTLINTVLLSFFKQIILSNLMLYIVLQISIFIFELFVTASYSNKINNVNINKILKGGKL